MESTLIKGQIAPAFTDLSNERKRQQTRQTETAIHQFKTAQQISTSVLGSYPDAQ